MPRWHPDPPPNNCLLCLSSASFASFAVGVRAGGSRSNALGHTGPEGARMSARAQPRPFAEEHRMQNVTLDDKYVATSGRIYLTGIQALVRLPLIQRQRDLAAGLNTAGFISGYRGSPLGGLDEALWKAKDHLEKNHVKFQPGVNEELAATAVWGSQQVKLVGASDYDGV